jgi:hypothetical protein
VKWVFAVVACTACGRVDFDPGTDVTVVDHCATATFTNPSASSFIDDFSSGVLTARWFPVDPCIAETGSELVASPLPSGRYCHAWTNGDYHLSCDAITVHVPEVTAPELGVQTYLYIFNLTDNVSNFDVLLEAGGIAFGPSGAGFTYDAIADAWWQVSEHDGALTIATAPDGIMWTPKSTIATPFAMDHVQVALGAGTYKAVASPGQARFHCYNVPPPCD